MTRASMVLAIVGALFLSAFEARKPLQPGERVESIELSDAAGATARLSLVGGRPVAVVFISTTCPVSNDYNDRLSDLHRRYSLRVDFVFVNANDNEPAAAVAAHIRQAGFPFPVYKDPGNRVADRFGAELTPEAFVFDGSGALRYHGAIDDSRNPARVRVAALPQAIDALLAGGKVAIGETRAFGCAIKRVRSSS